MSFWQRTSSSSFTSWRSSSLTCLGLCQLTCMTLPAARAALTATARAWFNGTFFIAASLTIQCVQCSLCVRQFILPLDEALFVFFQDLRRNFLREVRIGQLL